MFDHSIWFYVAFFGGAFGLLVVIKGLQQISNQLADISYLLTQMRDEAAKRSFARQ